MRSKRRKCATTSQAAARRAAREAADAAGTAIRANRFQAANYIVAMVTAAGSLEVLRHAVASLATLSFQPRLEFVRSYWHDLVEAVDRSRGEFATVGQHAGLGSTT